MAFSHGKDGAFKIDNNVGTLTEITSYVSSVDPSLEVETADVTVMGSVGHRVIPGLTNGSISVEGPWDPAVGTILFGASGSFGTLSSTRTWEWFPQGTASGKPKISAEGIITAYNVPGDIGEAVVWSMEVAIDGTTTLSTV